MHRRGLTRACALLCAGLYAAGCRRPAPPPPAPTPAQAQRQLVTIAGAAEVCLSDRPGPHAGAAGGGCVERLAQRLDGVVAALRDDTDRETARLLGALLELTAAQAQLEQRDAKPAERYRLALRRACLDDVEPAMIYEQALLRLGELQSELRALMASHGAAGDPRDFLLAQAQARQRRPYDVVARDAYQRLAAASQPLGYLAGPAPRLRARPANDMLSVDPVALAHARAAGSQLELEPAPEPYDWLVVDAAMAAAAAPGRLLAAQAVSASQRPAPVGGALDLPLFWGGWQLYAARLARSLGAYPDVGAEAGLLAFEAVAAARAAADVGLHGLGLERAQVEILFRGHTLLGAARIARELEVIERHPARAAAAFVGARAFTRVVDAATRRLGGEVAPGTLYAALLAAGPTDEVGLAAAATRYRGDLLERDLDVGTERIAR